MRHIDSSTPRVAYMLRWTGSVLVQVMARHRKGHKTITWTNADLFLSIGPLGTNFSENRIEILIILFTKMRLKMLSAKWWPFGPGGDELTLISWYYKRLGFFVCVMHMLFLGAVTGKPSTVGFVYSFKIKFSGELNQIYCSINAGIISKGIALIAGLWYRWKQQWKEYDR